MLLTLDKTKITINCNMKLTELSNGMHSVAVYASDSFGNIGASQTINFTVSQPFPTTTVIVVVSAIIVAVTAGLLAYRMKNKTLLTVQETLTIVSQSSFYSFDIICL